MQHVVVPLVLGPLLRRKKTPAWNCMLKDELFQQHLKQDMIGARVAFHPCLHSGSFGLSGNKGVGSALARSLIFAVNLWQAGLRMGTRWGTPAQIRH